MTPLIFGLAGPRLSTAEKAFFHRINPWGFILFARNIEDPDQVRGLTQALRDCVGRDAPVLIDQEGGRVQRLGPPHWPIMPPGAAYGALYARDRVAAIEAAGLGARLIAESLRTLGIDIDCLPVLDRPVPGAHDVIGDRALGATVDQIVALGRAQSIGLMAGGVLPVMKHVPGHGRAGADSHETLPVVTTLFDALDETDFAPFRELNHLPLAMTAHVLFADIDRDACASHSAPVIEGVIRRRLGFDGLLMCDDIGMKALGGDFSSRAVRALEAGCDLVLHSSGVMAEMEAVMGGHPVMTGIARDRSDRVLALRGHIEDFDPDEGAQRFARLMAGAAA